ncbi:MAG TPA: MHS family MFS transporter [Syntrophaceticus sp.]|nr:MHS family MFS transporter [Syntrophaceticus sp.]
MDLVVEQLEKNSTKKEQEYSVGLKRAVFAASIGNAIEWFDYASYGYLATVIASVFFPPGDRTLALLATFAVFAISFIIRPIGGVVWGHYGDKLGRRLTLILEVSIMSAATFAIGLIPSYASIGVLAPILLLLCRIVQGFSASGEYAGAASFIAEYAPPKKRGLLVSLVPASTAFGLMTGCLIVAVLEYLLPEAALHSWGWRIPFLLALPFGSIVLYMRMKLEDTPVFTEMKEKAEAKKSEDTIEPGSFAGVMKYKKNIIRAFCVILLNAIGFYILLSYMPTYLTEEVGFGKVEGTLITLITLSTYSIMLPIIGSIADRVGRKPVMMTACILFVLATYPAFILLSKGFGFSVLALFLLGAMLAGNDGVLATFLSEMFPTQVRYTSFALAFNTGNALFGGTAPFISTYLIALTGNKYAPAFYLMIAAVVCFVALIGAKESAHKELPTA